MAKKRKSYIIYHTIGAKWGCSGIMTWYVCELEYYDNSEYDWVLGCTLTQRKKKAIKLYNKEKAVKIAKILTEQIDEEGGCANYLIEEIK